MGLTLHFIYGIFLLQFGGQPSQARAATAAAAFRPLPDAAAGASRAASPALNAAAPWTTRAPLPAVAAPLRPPVQGGGPEPEPSYKTAFRQVTAPHKPAFDPPPAPVLWPRRQSPPSGSPSQPGNAEPAEAAAASRPTAGDSFTANADDRAVQRSRSDGPPAVDAAAIAANARQQLQLEADRSASPAFPPLWVLCTSCCIVSCNIDIHGCPAVQLS